MGRFILIIGMAVDAGKGSPRHMPGMATAGQRVRGGAGKCIAALVAYGRAGVGCAGVPCDSAVAAESAACLGAHVPGAAGIYDLVEIYDEDVIGAVVYIAVFMIGISIIIIMAEGTLIWVF